MLPNTTLKKGNSIILMTLFCCLLPSALIAQTEPQSEKLLRISESSMEAHETLDCPPGAALLIDVLGDPVGCESLQEEEGKIERVVELRSGARFTVVPLLGTFLSAGGNTILKFGDMANLYAAQADSNFILYAGDGTTLMSTNNHSLNSAIAMGADGHFAIAGPRSDKQDLKHSYITLYSPGGEEKYATPLEPGLHPAKLAISRSATTVAVSATDARRQPKGLSDILLYNNEGAPITSAQDVKYINHLVFVGDGEQDLLVFSINSLTCLTSSSGTIKWRIPQFFRLAGPFGVALSPDNRLLSIVTAEIEGRKDNQYPWRLHLLSMENGLSLSSKEISGTHPVRRSRLIDWVSEHSFNLNLPGKERLAVQFD